jgi:hypothetical protein
MVMLTTHQRLCWCLSDAAGKLPVRCSREEQHVHSQQALLAGRLSMGCCGAAVPRWLGEFLWVAMVLLFLVGLVLSLVCYGAAVVCCGAA